MASRTDLPFALLTFDEAREWLKISEPTLNRLLRDRELPVVRVRRRRFIRSDDLEAFVQAHTEPAGDA